MMKREISQRAVTIFVATLASITFVTTTADAQIFGGLKGRFRQRGDDCCPQIQQCCLPGQSWNQGGNWGGGTSWGTQSRNQGQILQGSANCCGDGYSQAAYGNVGYNNSGYNSSMGLSSDSWSSGGQMVSHGQVIQNQPTTSGMGYSDGTQYSGTTQGYQSNQNSSTQTNSNQNNSFIQGQGNNQYQPGNAQPQTQPHHAYSVRPESQPNTDNRTETGNWAGASSSGESINKSMSCFIASKFALQNESAADASSQIMNRLKSSDVKDLAKQMADDHAKLAVDFRTIATSGQSNTSAQSGDQQSNMNQSKLGPFTALYEMCERADEQQKGQMDKMMSDLSEDEIDMGYVGTLLVCHRSMLAELKAAQETVSDNELKSKLDKAIETVQQHLEKTEQVYEELRS